MQQQSTRASSSRRSDSSERISDLAKLPLFWDLAGKSVVVAGGSEGAAWKAELMMAAGAIVHVYCPEDALGDTMQTLLRKAEDPETTKPPAAILHAHQWHLGIFAGASMALADCETDAEAHAFACAAKAAGVPVNVIDKPAHCQFQFGSIVNRSPVIVAISTDGAAPILAQAIRRRIETLLPPALKDWARLAHNIREEVNIRLTPGPRRRRFWEGFVDSAFSTTRPPTETEHAGFLEKASILGDAPATGRVTLVGAGPGDAELLTLKAMRALQAADVILFDDLVSDEVLELARREAKRMLVGKRGGRASCHQEDINEMMVKFARAGKHVVRLKSGDPMIFGRAGEEIERLRREGIAVDVVPGITAAIAMAAALGVSLTHRDHAQQVRFVTGHSRHGELPDKLDWKGLADPNQTTVFYMGGRMAGRIEQTLRNSGMPASTPAVVVSAISRFNEQRWAGSLGQLRAAVDDLGLERPILIGVGQAFSASTSTAQADRPMVRSLSPDHSTLHAFR